MKVGVRENELLRLARERSGMEQKRTAEKVQVTPPTMCKYEKGELPIPSDVVVKLYNTPMGRTRTFYKLLCLRCEIGKLNICDGTKCPVGRSLDRRQKQRLDAA